MKEHSLIAICAREASAWHTNRQLWVSLNSDAPFAGSALRLVGIDMCIEFPASSWEVGCLGLRSSDLAATHQQVVNCRLR